MPAKNERLGVHVERGDRGVYLCLRVAGKLTREDYRQLEPMVEQALSGVDEPSILALIDARAFEGWDLQAFWEDLKLGLAHGREFKKVAVVGQGKWQAVLSRVAGLFVAGQTAFFTEREPALDWLGV